MSKAALFRLDRFCETADIGSVESLKNNKTRGVERILIFCVIAAVFSSLIISTRLAQRKSEVTMRRLDEGWYWINGDKRVDVTLPCKITVPRGQNLTLCYSGLTAAEGSRTVLTRGAVYQVTIKVDGHPIYEYDDRGFKRNQQMQAKMDCMGILPEDPSDSTLSMTFKNQGNDYFNIKPVYVGRSSDMILKLWNGNLLQILGVFTMSIIATFCLLAHFYLNYMKVDDSRMGSAALFLLLCSIWRLMGSSLAQQIGTASQKMCVVAIYSFMALPIPLIHFVRSTQKMYKYYILDFMLYLAYGNILLQALLHIMMGTNYVDMLPITHLVQCVILGVICYLLYREYQLEKDFEILAVLQGGLILCAAGALDLILYWVLRSPLYGAAMELGILAFILRMLFAVLSTMTSNIRFKAEAMVYKRLSREDRLTGLANRRAFDEAMADMDEHSNRYGDAALFFLDVNGLKMINDKYGHHAGDELIISAARCISYAFEDKGTCYRLGGDEFAAIIPDPDFSSSQWAQKIDEALVHQNATCHWNLSVAWGVSYLRDHGGNVKRSSDWLYEADQAMYTMKTAMKATREDLAEANK